MGHAAAPLTGDAPGHLPWWCRYEPEARSVGTCGPGAVLPGGSPPDPAHLHGDSDARRPPACDGAAVTATLQRPPSPARPRRPLGPATVEWSLRGLVHAPSAEPRTRRAAPSRGCRVAAWLALFVFISVAPL